MLINGNSVLIPEYGYTATITMLSESIVLGNGKTETFDYGITNDKYRCDLKWRQSGESASTFEGMMLDPAQQDSPYTLQDVQDFKPFGPHWNATEYYAHISNGVNSGKSNIFGKSFDFDISLINATAQSISAVEPDVRCEGSMSFGTFNDLPYPKYSYKRTYDVTKQNTAGNTLYSVVEREDRAREFIDFEFSLNGVDAQNFVYYLVTEVRFARTTVTPSANYYFRGTDNAPFDVALTLGEIECTHVRYDRWSVKFKAAIL